MARQQIGWVSRGQYFTGYPEEKRAQQQVLPRSYISPYLTGEERRIAERKRTRETIRQQQEESRLEGLLSRRAKGLGAGYPGQPSYVAPRRLSMQQQRANLAELQSWRRMKTGYGGMGGYVAPGQYVSPATSLSFMGGGQPSPQQIMPTYQATPTSEQPVLGKFTTPTAPPPTPTMAQRAPTTGYQSTYYQANGYGGYQQAFGDKPFAYQRPRLQQSHTGI